MNQTFYLTAFQEALSDFDKNLLSQKHLDVEAGVWLDSVVLRFQKKNWVNKPDERPHADAAIFFSIWINDKTIQENRIFYNIHALKLRQLKGYTITSRAFAAAFRTRFKPFEHQWPHISVDFGPLTLMEGWVNLPTENIRETVFTLGSKFLTIDPLIDELLDEYKKTDRHPVK